MEWIIAGLVVLGATAEVLDTPDKCKVQLEESCKPFLQRQTDYAECMNLIELEKLKGLRP